MSSIDPNVPGIFFGEVTKMQIVDTTSTIPGAIGNFVLDPSQPFDIEIEWYIDGAFAPAMKVAMQSVWQLRLLAESQGPGPEPVLASIPVSVSSGTTVGNRTTWNYTHTVPANTIPDGTVLKLIAVVRDTVAGPVDIAGYAEGPVVLTERP